MYKPTALVMILTVHLLIELLVQHHTGIISAVAQTILLVHHTILLQWYLVLLATGGSGVLSAMERPCR